MKETLSDIKTKIETSSYTNEEHVRLSLVARVLKELGWNIWDPREVNTEYIVRPGEDSSRVDIALFLTPRRPEVYVEVKSMGKISLDLQNVENQLRDYNRDNTALLTIITDGRVWRFYLSQTGGKFSEKCFKVIDFVDDDLDEILLAFSTFLQRTEVDNGNAIREAESYLRLTEKQRVLESLLPKARRATQEDPYPSLPDALVELVAEEGFPITSEEAKEFIRDVGTKAPPILVQPVQKEKAQIVSNLAGGLSSQSERVMVFQPDRPPNLHFAKILEASFASETASKWNGLVRTAVAHAITQGVALDKLRALSVPVDKGHKTTEGFHPLTGLRGTQLSVQGVDAGKAWLLASAIAKEVDAPIKVRFRWREKDGAQHPGKEGLLQWSPH